MRLLHRTLAVAVIASGILAISVAVTIAGEVFVRHHERHRVTVPGTMPLLYYPHARLRHALVRDYDYFGWASVNPQGFRGAPVDVSKRPDAIRLMIVGASTTFDHSIGADSSTWPARLEHWLKDLHPQREVEVINAGVGGYVVLDNLIRLQMELHRYEPDAIVLYHAHNDLFGALRRASPDTSVSRRPGEVRATPPWTRWLASHSLLYTKVRARIRAIQFRRGGARAAVAPEAEEAVWNEVVERGGRGFEHDVDSFLALADRFGIPVVLVEPVHVGRGEDPNELSEDARDAWNRAVPFAPLNAVLTGYESFHKILEEVAVRWEADFVKTADFGLDTPDWYATGDPIHFNPRGADRMGRHMALVLLESGLLH